MKNFRIKLCILSWNRNAAERECTRRYYYIFWWLKYEIWLRAYNDYTYIWASSTAYNVLMDTISTICKAYYKSGKLIDEDVRSLSGSGNIQNCSAIVEVPKNPFNYQAYSAISTHSFYRKGYEPYQKVVTWRR